MRVDDLLYGLTSWPERRGHKASSSSKKMTQGAELRPLWKTCLTARSLSPTYCQHQQFHGLQDLHRDYFFTVLL